MDERIIFLIVESIKIPFLIQPNSSKFKVMQTTTKFRARSTCHDHESRERAVLDLIAVRKHGTQRLFLSSEKQISFLTYM